MVDRCGGGSEGKSTHLCVLQLLYKIKLSSLSSSWGWVRIWEIMKYFNGCEIEMKMGLKVGGGMGPSCLGEVRHHDSVNAHGTQNPLQHHGF